MLNAVSSGSRLANVTPVRSGGRSSNSLGSRERSQAANATATISMRARRGAAPLKPCVFASGAAPRRPRHVCEPPAGPRRNGDAAGGPGGEAPRGVGGSLSGSRTAGATGRRSRFIPAAVTKAGALSRRPDPDRLPAARSEHEVQARRRVDGALRNGDRQRVREPVGARSVRVDLGDVFAPRREEREGDVEGPRFLVGNGAYVPARTVPLPPRND